MKKIELIILILCIFIFFVPLINTKVYGTDSSKDVTDNSIKVSASQSRSTIDKIFSGADNFIDSANDKKDLSGNDVGTYDINEDNLKNAHYFVFNVLLIIAFVVAAIVGIILGMQFMFAGVEEKADAKQRLVVFFIGMVVTFGAFGIWRAILKIVENI